MNDLKYFLNTPVTPGVNWPVSSGVPFPRGEFRPEDTIKLRDEDGHLIECQTEPIVMWPDGSVRWLLVDLIADMKDGGKYYYNHPNGSNSTPHPHTLSIEENIGEILIDTGVMSLRIPHYNSPTLIDKIMVNGEPASIIGYDSTVEQTDGTLYKQGNPTVIKIERDGPLHAIIFSSGNYAAQDYAYRYEYRFHFYAGLPLIRMEHSIINQCSEVQGTHLRNVNIDFKLKDNETLKFNEDIASQLKQVSSSVYEIDGRQVKGRYNGSVEVDGLFTLCVADFWQRFPKAIAINDSTLSIKLLDDSNAGTLCAQGEAQTHDIWIWLGDNAPGASDMARLVNQRPILVPPVEWICKTKAFGELAPYDPEKNPSYEEKVEKCYEQILKTQEELDEYGYRDYGDSRYDAMPRGWLNNEYDWGHAYFLQFARTGDRKYFDFALSRVRHMMDTDIIHYKSAPDSHLIGAPHAHSTDHTDGGVDLGHAWLEGLFDYWAFLGEPRAYQHGVSMGDFFASCVGNVLGPRYKNRPGARRPGWGLIALMYAYEYTLDKKYLDAAKKVVSICAREQVKETGAWVYSGGCLDDPTCPIGKSFMVALTLTGIQRYHKATGDPLAKESFLKGLDWAIDALWDERVGGFRYIDAPHDDLLQVQAPGSFANHMMEPLAYGYKITGNPRYQYVASRTWRKWVEEQNDIVLRPSDIRDVVHYLPQHVESPQYSGEFPLYSVRTNKLPHIRRFFFHDEKRGWALGLYGLLLWTEDGGCNWEMVPIDYEEHFYGMDFVNDKLGWIAGQGDKVFRTVDGGKSWIPVDTSHVPGPKYHYDVVFTNEKVGYISGIQHIWGTTDSGCSWSRIWNVHEDGRWDKMSKVISMFPLSPDKIWAVGDHNLSMTMEGYGERFVKHANPIGGGICVYFLDSKRGFVSGVLGRIWRTLDGGVTWEMKQIADDTIYQVQFFNEDIGYAAGKRGSIFVTNDGGDTWQYKDTGFNETLRALVVLSETTALVAGDGGLMLRTDDGGKSWEKISIPG